MWIGPLFPLIRTYRQNHAISTFTLSRTFPNIFRLLYFLSSHNAPLLVLLAVSNFFFNPSHFTYTMCTSHNVTRMKCMQKHNFLRYSSHHRDHLCEYLDIRILFTQAENMLHFHVRWGAFSLIISCSHNVSVKRVTILRHTWTACSYVQGIL